MRRSDRLFQIVNYLQGRKLAITADQIAEELEVCVRTVYRDMRDLMLSGVPIQSEAGVGYMLDKDYHLPPLMFDVEEIEALVLGAAMVGSWTDEQMAGVSRRVLDKVKAALPDRSQSIINETALFALPSAGKLPWTVDFGAIRRSIRSKNKINISYADENGDQTKRTIRPLAMASFAPVWLVMGWCELRNDFRSFRLDRIEEMDILEKCFKDEPGKTLDDYLNCVEQEP